MSRTIGTDIVGPAIVGEVGRAMKMRRLGRGSTVVRSASLQVAIAAVHVATIDEAVQVGATDRRRHKVLKDYLSLV